MSNEEPKNETRQDAFQRLTQARLGCFVNAKEEYLISLRSFLFDWIAATENKLASMYAEEAQRIENENC